MPATDTSNTGLFPTKEQAFKLRQRDTGWGWSFAHLLPFVGLYYAFSRRTITPAFSVFAGCFTLGIVLSLAGAVNEDNEDSIAALAGYALTAPLTKLGQESARKHAAKKLGIEA